MNTEQNHTNKPIEERGENAEIPGYLNILEQMERIDNHKALKQVKNKINVHLKHYKLRLNIQRIAAILTIPILSFVIWQSVKISTFDQNISEHTITTPPTLRSVFTLPDGSKVWLNGNTTISYPFFFKEKERLVSLNGEAYFEVAKNRSKPFIVKTGNLLIEAVGTEFNCLSYQTDVNQNILLTEGKINIHSEQNDIRKIISTLTTNQLATYNKKTRNIAVQDVDPEEHIAWKDGKIIFKNDKLEHVLEKLEHWYNVEFIYSKNIRKNHAFTGSFENDPLPQILKCIEMTTPIIFEELETSKNKKTDLPEKKDFNKKNYKMNEAVGAFSFSNKMLFKHSHIV